MYVNHAFVGSTGDGTGTGKTKTSLTSVKDESDRSVVPPCFTRASRQGPYRVRDLRPILLRCDGRARRGLKGHPRRPRGSKTMFSGAFGTRFQLPGLSVTCLSAYSSLHCL